MVYGLMIGTVNVAILGTFASSFCPSFNIKSITQIGKLDKYYGIKFTQPTASGEVSEETKFYYLNSRYYNPVLGRFINADGLIGQTGDILGHNMYAYTRNNPVMYYDPNGEIAIETIILITAIVAGVGVFTYTAVDSYNKTGNVDLLGATINGIITFGTVYCYLAF